MIELIYNVCEEEIWVQMQENKGIKITGLRRNVCKTLYIVIKTMDGLCEMK